MSNLTAVLLKMFLDRREHRGAREFAFGWRPGKGSYHRISVRALDGDFTSEIALRRAGSDLATFEQVFVYNAFNLKRLPRWDEIYTAYSTRDPKKKPLILDLGANIGLASLYFAKNWPTAEIVALEPGTSNYQMMLQNVSGRKSIHPLHAAIACEDGAVRISNPEAEAWAYRTEAASFDSGGAIPAMSVSSILKMPQISGETRPFIAKIDIESFEDNLFSKNTEWVELFPIIIIELHDWMADKRGSSRNFLQTIARYDRDFFYKGENVFSLTRDLSG